MPYGFNDDFLGVEDAVDDDATDGGTTYTMLWDVEDITFEYWDSTREIAGEAWVRQWDAEDHEGQLPSRVRMTVEVPHPTRRRETLEFATQTEIHLTDPILMLPPAVFEQIQEHNRAVEELLSEVQDQQNQRRSQ